MSDSDNDISWLTQRGGEQYITPNFDIGHDFDVELLDEDNVVSLEEDFGMQNGHVLYDNFIG